MIWVSFLWLFCDDISERPEQITNILSTNSFLCMTGHLIYQQVCSLVDGWRVAIHREDSIKYPHEGFPEHPGIYLFGIFLCWNRSLYLFEGEVIFFFLFLLFFQS